MTSTTNTAITPATVTNCPIFMNGKVTPGYLVTTRRGNPAMVFTDRADAVDYAATA